MDWRRNRRSYISGRWSVEQPRGNVIALWASYLSSGCVPFRALLALEERWESQIRIGTDFCSRGTSNGSWVGRSGCQKGIQRGLATWSICYSGANSSRKPVQSGMGRMLEEARAAAHKRRAQFETVAPPLCPQDTSPSAGTSEHLVTVMGESPPIASQEGFCLHGVRDPSKRGRFRGQGSRLGSRQILAEIATNVSTIEQQNGDVTNSVRGRSDGWPPRAHGGFVRGRVRGRRGRGGGMLGSPTTPALRSKARSDNAPSEHTGWIAPQILSDRLSPISLRPRLSRWDTIGGNLGVSGEIVDLTALDAPWGSDSNSDTGEGFTTPPRRETAARNTDQKSCEPPASVPIRGSARGLCQFSLQDFEPGAPPPSAAERQCIGEYHPNLHDCGVADCPFTEITPESRLRAAQLGLQVEGNLSPGDHPKVDHRAFPTPVYVNALVDVLGHDSSLFSGV